ncbi:MAG TPA: hypothetical protein PLL28_14510, partial [Chitinophagales bacterium]|nr:hypothetical protein [Chitinophagales bacterium]
MLISTLLCISFVSVDGQVMTGPGVQWMAEHWYDDNGTIIQDDSGEDWYYDIKPYFDETDNFVGYVAAGFSDIVNETLPGAECLSCGENEVLCYFFETEAHQMGCSRPKLAEMDLLGDVEWYYLYGPENSKGHLRSVVQTESGYVAVGQLKFEGGEGIPYNYEIGSTGEELTLCTEPELDGKPYTVLYLVQTDMEGEDPIERVYGWASPEDAGLYTSEGYQILEDIDGSGYLIIGITEV